MLGGGKEEFWDRKRMERWQTRGRLGEEMEVGLGELCFSGSKASVKGISPLHGGFFPALALVPL